LDTTEINQQEKSEKIKERKNQRHYKFKKNNNIVGVRGRIFLKLKNSHRSLFNKTCIQRVLGLSYRQFQQMKSPETNLCRISQQFQIQQFRQVGLNACC